jgi:WD40 repeat protein/serine/threonine protein kinase
VAEHSLINQTIKGYEILSLIDEGGFGAIYRAVQQVVQREVAIKVILPQFANRSAFIRRFEAEAQLVARLEHLHIVPLYDFWRDPDGAYLVMRWLRGGSVRDQLLIDGQWAADQTAQMVDQIASALDVAHDAGVVHRDIKPGNILLDDDGNSFLADFGIALDTDVVDGDQSMMVGSPAYMAPELIRGEVATPQSDQYSLAVVAYHVLVGHRPFETQSRGELLMRQLDTPMPPVTQDRPELPTAIDEVLIRASAKEASDRYPNVMEFAREFRAAVFSGQQRSSFNKRSMPDLQTLELAAVKAPSNPYRGLRAFSEADETFFFGRERLVRRLLESLNAKDEEFFNFLALVGPSGSGKSSVVSAGVFPALRRGELPGSEEWYLVEMLPGSQPMRALEAAMLSVAADRPSQLLGDLNMSTAGFHQAIERVLPDEDNVRLFLHINQFEEIFTQVEQESDREHFLQSLHRAITAPGTRLTVLVTLRADFYDRPLLYADFGRLVRQRTEVVLPLSADEFEAAITGPALRVGLNLQAGLVATIVEDVEQQPGALPLMQYALTELFERRDGFTLTLDAYLDVGGISGALVRRADDVYKELSVSARELSRQVFLRLVNIGQGTEDTRRRARQSMLRSLTQDDAALDEVLDTFGKYRLLTFDNDPNTREPTVQIAHEALIRRWQRFQGWLNDSREELQLHRKLAAAVDEWDESGYDPSFLASGLRLEQFEAWANATEMALSQRETNYLSQSIIYREDLLSKEEVRLAREVALKRRSANTMRALVMVFFVATVIALVLAGLAATQRQEAQDARSVAEVRAAEAADSALQARQAALDAARSANRAQTLAWASSAQLVLADNDTDLAIALGLQAASRLTNAPDEAKRALAAAAYAPGTRGLFRGHIGAVNGVAVSPDGNRAVSISDDNQIIVWNLNDSDDFDRITRHGAPILSVAMNHVGSMVASGDADGNLYITGLVTRVEGELVGHHAPVLALDYSRDDSLLVSSDAAGTIIVWDVESRSIIQEWRAAEVPIHAVIFNENGRRIYLGSDDGLVSEWGISANAAIIFRDLEAHTGPVFDLALNPAARTLLSASGDGTVIHWDLVSGRPIATFDGHSDAVMTVDFTQDGMNAFSGSVDASIIMWNVRDAIAVQRFGGHNGGISGLAVVPGHQQIVSGSFDRSVRLWDTVHGLQTHLFAGHTGPVLSLTYSPDGRHALSGGTDNLLLMWDMVENRLERQMTRHFGSINDVAWLPDGNHAISASDDETLILWDVNTGEAMRSFDGHTNRVRAVAVSPDGTRAVSGGDDRFAIVWDTENSAQIMRLRGHDGPIRDVAISPDGQSVLTASEDMGIIHWNLETGRILRRLGGHSDAVLTVTFSPNPRYAVSGAADGRIIYWDLQTGALLNIIEGHIGPVYDTAFTLNGSGILSGSADRTMRIWDVATGAEIARFTGHGASVISVAMEPFGRHALSGSAAGIIREWEVPYSFNALVQWTFSNRYVRSLTCAERELYSVTPLCGG